MRKMTVDILMTAALLGLMTYSFLGEKAHEWLGMVMFFLFVSHHMLNLSWLKNLGRGKYSPYRIFQTVLVFLIFLSMLGSMVSGILISQYLFSRWTQPDLFERASLVHLFCAYWGFILMSMHIGLHWRMIQGIIKNRMKKECPGILKQGLRFWTLGIVIYGVHAFAYNQIVSYLFLQTHFVMYDFDATFGSVLWDYLAIMGLFVFLGYVSGGFLQRIGNRRAGKEKISGYKK